MAYSLQVYINANLSISDLERRVKNLEPLIRVNLKDYNSIKRAMEDFGYGQIRLKEIQAILDDLKEEATNIITVIELKKAGEL